MNYEALAVEFMEIMQACNKAKPDKHIYAATQGEGYILYYIAINGGNVLPGEIGCKMDVSTARIATVLNKLEKKGLITRQIDTHDRRKIIVDITPEGKETAEKHYRTTIGNTAKMLEHLGEHDAKEYVRIMGKLSVIFSEFDCRL